MFLVGTALLAGYSLGPAPADEPVRSRGLSCLLVGRYSWPESIAGASAVSRGFPFFLSFSSSFDFTVDSVWGRSCFL